MEQAMVGLGRMGVNMATRLMRGNHRIVAYDLNETAIQHAETEGAEGARSFNELKDKLPIISIEKMHGLCLILS